MILTNLIAALVLTNSVLPSVIPSTGYIPYIGNNPSFSNTTPKKEEIKNFFKENSEALLVNSSSLIYKDIYVATKPNVGKKITNITVYDYDVTNINANSKAVDKISIDHFETVHMETKPMVEKNPVADVFFSHNLWDVGFVSANVFNMFAIDTLNKIDSTGISGYAYSLTLTILEANAINSWVSYLPKDFHFEAPLISYRF